MTELNKTKPSIARRGWSIVQWIVSIFLLLIALIFATGSDALNAPGAPVAGYYASVGVLALVAVSLSPPIFFRLPKAGKWLAYIAVLPAIMFVGAMLVQVQAAYERTPEGAKEAEARAENEKEEAIAAAREAEVQAAADKKKAETAELLAKAEAEAEAQREVAASMAEDEAKLADCLAFFGGGVPDLKDRVKEALHNPSSFEHVETTFFGVSGKNTFMQFRAENGFGAIRSSQVNARVDPDTCKVTELGDFSGM